MSTKTYKEMREAVITVNEILLATGRPVFKNKDLIEAIITINAVNIDRGNAGFKLGKAGTLRLDGAMFKDVSESKNPDAKALITAIETGEKMAKKGKVNDRFEIRDGVLFADSSFFKQLGDDVQKALKKGVELAAEAAKTPKTPAPAAAAPAKAPAAPAAPKYNPELLSKWLAEANALVAAGKDLSSMSPEAQKAVEIQPAEVPVRAAVVVEGETRLMPVPPVDGKPVMEANPHAGTVGLSRSAFQHVTGVINAAERIVANPKTAQGDVKEAQARLVAYKDVLSEARASMGIVAKEVAPTKEVAGPALAP